MLHQGTLSPQFFPVLSAHCLYTLTIRCPHRVIRARGESVFKSSLYVLLSGIRAAHHNDIFVTCGCFCLFKGTFDTVGDKGKRRFSLGRRLFSNIMRKYKTWHVKLMVISLSNVERSSVHHNLCSFEWFLKNPTVTTSRACARRRSWSFGVAIEHPPCRL